MAPNSIQTIYRYMQGDIFELIWDKYRKAEQDSHNLVLITTFEDALQYDILKRKFMLRIFRGTSNNLYWTYEPIQIGVLSVETVKYMIENKNLFLVKK